MKTNIKSMRINVISIVLITLCSFFATSCEDENYMVYDTSQNGTYFYTDTFQYSFGVTPLNIRACIIEVPVMVMGEITDVPREIGFEVIADTTTAVEGVQYVIGEAKVMPDSIYGVIPVIVLRDGLGGTYAEGYDRYRLGLRLLPNEYFTPTLSKAEHVFILHFDNAVEQPNWLTPDGEKVWIERELGVWHPYKLIKMVEYFHAIKDIHPETYKKMVAAYGENLEHIPYGDPNMYRTIFRKYIYKPMYDFFSDPANRDMILAEYPDFPFDFPNPYAK